MIRAHSLAVKISSRRKTNRRNRRADLPPCWMLRRARCCAAPWTMPSSILRRCRCVAVEDASPWRMRHRGRSRRRCTTSLAAPSPQTNTTSLAAESLTTSADNLPETTSTAAQIAAPRHQIAAVSLRWRDEIDAVSTRRNRFSGGGNGERQFASYTAADMWVLAAV
jgi:hypothetical protein